MKMFSLQCLSFIYMKPSLTLSCFLSSTSGYLDVQSPDGIECALERCEIGVVGEDLNPEYESMSLDVSSAWQRGLETENNSRSLQITGNESF